MYYRFFFELARQEKFFIEKRYDACAWDLALGCKDTLPPANLI